MTSRSSTTDPAAGDDITVGFIRKPHGVRGELVVEPHTAVAGRFAPGARLGLRVPGVAATNVTVLGSRPHGSVMLVTLEGVADRDRAEELRDGVLTVGADQAVAAEEGVYFHFELVGCACFDRAAGAIGTVVEVVEDGGGTLLRIAEGESDCLVPFVRDHLVAVDRDRRRIDLDLPEGLLETCRSPS